MASTRKSLEERIRVLEDTEAIKRLKHEYCFALDLRDWDAVAEMFAEDGTVDYGDIGSARGRPAIRRLFVDRISKDFAIFVHMAHNPVIDLKGDRASGRWYFDIPATVSPDKARWIVGWYDDEYVRGADGRWRYASLKSSYFYVSSYEKGWGKERFVDQG